MIHDGHRKRIRKKFTDGGIMEDHEILEMVLFFSIPRANTNEIAHRLLEQFGSLRGVFNASMASLETVDGIGPASAFQIRLISECISRYFLERHDTRDLLHDQALLSEYLSTLFIGCDYEKAIMLFFSASGRLLGTVEIGDGETNLVFLNPREMLSSAIQLNASYAVMAHSHPDGVPFPSDKDLTATLRLSKILASINVQLVNHYIVAGNQCRVINYQKEDPPCEIPPLPPKKGKKSLKSPQ